MVYADSTSTLAAVWLSADLLALQWVCYALQAQAKEQQKQAQA